MESQISIITVNPLGGVLLPIDLQGAREVFINNGTIDLRVYQDLSGNGDYFLIPQKVVGENFVFRTLSNDGYLYLVSDSPIAGGDVFIWVVR
jgi:hypothetical protein